MSGRGEDEVWALLERGGLLRAGPEEDYRDGYDPLRDPAGAETLGGLLAERALTFAPTLVATWGGIGSVVLGFVVAARLGVPALRLYDSEGLVRSSGEPPPRGVAVLVADVAPRPAAAEAIEGVLARRGATVAAALSLVGPPAPGDGTHAIPQESLVTLDRPDAGER